MPGQCPNVKGRGHRPHADVEAAVEACLEPKLQFRREAKRQVSISAWGRAALNLSADERRP